MMPKLLGILLFVIGVYFLGQNIIIATTYSPYWWRDIPAAASVLTIMCGMLSLLFFRHIVGNLGWILLIIGVILVFLSGGIILKPTSLWEFFIAFAALAGGLQLITQGRIRL